MKTKRSKLGIMGHLVLLGYILVALSMLNGCAYQESANKGIFHTASLSQKGNPVLLSSSSAIAAREYQFPAHLNSWERFELASMEAQLRMTRLEQRGIQDKAADLLNQEAALELRAQTLSACIAHLRNAFREDMVEEAQAESTTEFDRDAVYFISSSTRELKECGVLEPEHAIVKNVGVGKKLSGELEPAQFVLAERTKGLLIPVSGRKPRIVTPHPKDSYRLRKDRQGNITQVEVTDPDRFWQNGPYLVIVVA